MLPTNRSEPFAASVNRRPETVWNVVKRFNQYGLASLQDIPRSGRPLTYGEEARGQLVVTAKTQPQQLGLPYSHWTLGSLGGVCQPARSYPSRGVSWGRFWNKKA